MKYSFTVFTPTYNRAHTLARVYHSLRDQSFRDFEWLVVDDGSNDGTRELVAQWRQEASFPIRYVWQQNGHKKTAFNRGVKMAEGILFVCADSDDLIMPDALRLIWTHWSGIPEGERDSFVGICGLCCDSQGSIVGTKFPGSWGIDSDFQEIRYQHRAKGEKWNACLTSILRYYPFPEMLRGYVPESIVWSALALRFKTRFVNDVLRVYAQDAGNQVTNSEAVYDSPGFLYWKKCVLENELRWFWKNPLHFFLEASRWTRFCLHVTGFSRHTLFFIPRNVMGRLLVLLTAPVGFAWWVCDRLSKNR